MSGLEDALRNSGNSEEHMAQALKQLEQIVAAGAAQVILLLKSLASNADYSISIAQIAKNQMDAFEEQGFTSEQAYELTASLLKNLTEPK